MDNSRPVIITDIDNTILNNDRRKLVILHEKFNKAVQLEDVRRDYDLDGLLNGEKEKEEFWRIFFSEEYLRLDEPVPFSAIVLSDLVKKRDILYLTGRHDDEKTGDSMKGGTLTSLKKHGFPLDKKNTKIYFKDKRNTPDASFKASAIRSIVAERDVAFGVGDTPDDIKLYASFRILPVAIRTGYFRDEKLRNNAEVPPLILDNWKEVKNLERLI